MYGLPEQKINKVTFENVNIDFAEDAKSGVPAMMDGADARSRCGLFAKNLNTLEFINVKIAGQEGEDVILENVGQFIRK